MKAQTFSNRSFRDTWIRRAAWLGLVAVVLTTLGCANAPPPHVTAKVIFQHEDLAAEVSSEWHR
jgi:hypothetical protein